MGEGKNDTPSREAKKDTCHITLGSPIPEKFTDANPVPVERNKIQTKAKQKRKNRRKAHLV